MRNRLEMARDSVDAKHQHERESRHSAAEQAAIRHFHDQGR